MDLGAIVGAAGFVAYVYDPQRDLIHFATSDGMLHDWSVALGHEVGAFSIGGTPSSIDITADGAFLLIGNTASVQLADHSYVDQITRLNLSTHAVDQLQFSISGGPGFGETGVSHLAVAANGAVLVTTGFSGSGWNTFRSFQAADAHPVFTTVADLPSIRQSSYLLASDNRQHILIQEANISNGPLHVYDAATGHITYDNDLYNLGTSGFNSGTGDYNEARALVVDVTYNNIFVLNDHLSLVKNLSTLQSAGRVLSGAFDTDGNHLFIWQGDLRKILVLDTLTWQQIGTLDVQSAVGPGYIGNPAGQMDVISAGKVLSLGLGSGVELLDLTQDLKLIAVGDASDQVVNGAIGSDLLDGAGGADTLNGGAGADTLTGGSGRDVLNGGGGTDVFLIGPGDSGTVATGLDRIGDWSADETLAFANGPATNSNYLEATAADYASAKTLADAQIGAGVVDFVAVQVGADVVVFADSSADNGTADDAVLLPGRTLGDIDVTNISGPPAAGPPPAPTILNGGFGPDTLSGTTSADVIRGMDDNDSLSALSGADSVDGGAGADTLNGGAGADTLSGGGGVDRFVVGQQESGVALASLDQITDWAGTETLSFANGAVGPNSYMEATAADYASALSLANTQIATGSVDVVAVSVGANLIVFADSANDDVGADDAVVLLGRGLADFNSTNLGGPVDPDPPDPTTYTDYPGGSHEINGTQNREILNGLDGDDILSGFGSNDTLDGGTGFDTLVGGSGADLIITGPGDDLVVFGLGDAGTVPGALDVIADWTSTDHLQFANSAVAPATYLEGTAADFAAAQSFANAAISTGAANYVAVAIGGDVTVFADSANNNGVADDVVVLTGRGLADIDAMNFASGGLPPAGQTLTGGAGADSFAGGAGNDRFDGAGGADTLDGGPGTDTLTGGAGRDVITTGSGADVVVFGLGDSGITPGLFDAITDWGAGDQLAFANTGMAPGYLEGVAADFGSAQSLANFSIADGSVNFAAIAVGADVVVFVDSADNDGVADDIVVLTGRGLNDIDISSFATGAAAPPPPAPPAGDTQSGTSGPDRFFGTDQNDSLNGAGGDDFLGGSRGDDVLIGGDGNDELQGAEGSDTLDGGAGNDALQGFAGNDRLDGGPGVDQVVYLNATAGVTVNLSLTGPQSPGAGEGTDTLLNFENISGSLFPDVLTGDGGANLLFGWSGADTLTGGGGDDTLDGREDGDLLSGGEGMDHLMGAGAADTMTGGAGTDTFEFHLTGDSAAASALGGHLERLDHVTDWSNVDFLQFWGDAIPTNGNYQEITAASYDAAYSQSQSAFTDGHLNYTVAQIGADVVVFAPQFGEAVVLSGRTLSDISMVNLGPTAPSTAIQAPAPPPAPDPAPPPVFTGGGGGGGGGGGNSGPLSVAPSDRSDNLATRMHGDQIHGGLGEDTITGGENPDYLRGDEGNDLIYGGAVFDDINGNMGDDTASGASGNDWVVGGKDQDSLSGDGGDDIVWGNLGNDTLSGGEGDDQVRGGQGNDSLAGGFGDDFISGDRGDDTMTGGGGADRFHGSQDAGIDKVIDFNIAEGDRVMLDPGTTYTVTQEGPSVVIDMGGGHQMILAGVQLSMLPDGWIFYG